LCVHLSHVVAEMAIYDHHATLPARPLLRRTLEHRAEVGVALVGQGFGQDGRIVLNQVIRQPVFPGSSGVDATRADSPAKAVGCQTMKLACLLSPRP